MLTSHHCLIAPLKRVLAGYGTPLFCPVTPSILFTFRCSADSTYIAYTTGTQRFARFSFKAFQFLRATEAVYIQCKVLICPNTDKSRCRLGCRKRATRGVGSDHESQTLVLGPIQLKGLYACCTGSYTNSGSIEELNCVNMFS